MNEINEDYLKNKNNNFDKISHERYEKTLPIRDSDNCKVVVEKMNGKWRSHYMVGEKIASNTHLTIEGLETFINSVTFLPL